jgi:LysM repeat protein
VITNSKLYKLWSHSNNMKKGLLSLLAIPVLAATFVGCSPYHKIRIETDPTSIERYIDNSQIQSIKKKKAPEIFRRAPQYKRYMGYGTKCAGYSVLTSRDMFNKNMFYAKAWNLRYKNEIVTQVNGNNRLKQIAEDGTLKPGMIVAFYNPHSEFNNKKDEKGKRVKYTHTAVFAGERNDGKLIFYHQYVDRMEKISLEDLGKEYDCSAREVIDEKNAKIKRISKTNNFHTVRKGDTFWSIARRNNLSQQKLKKYNPRITPSKIYPHQKIRIR